MPCSRFTAEGKKKILPINLNTVQLLCKGHNTTRMSRINTRCRTSRCIIYDHHKQTDLEYTKINQINISHNIAKQKKSY